MSLWITLSVWIDSRKWIMLQQWMEKFLWVFLILISHCVIHWDPLYLTDFKLRTAAVLCEEARYKLFTVTFQVYRG